MKTKYLKIEKDPHINQRITLSSGDGEEYKGCKLTVAGFGYYCTLKLPAFIKPKATKVYPTSWDQATIKRLGRNYYYHYDEREYGVSLFEGYVSIYYGIQTDSSETEQRIGYFFPWTQNTFVRRTFYNLDGSVYANFPALTYKQKNALGRPGWDQEYEASKKVEKVYFSFLDYDFEEIIATCYIEEREWHRGEKWCSWLKYLTKPMISRCLDISFSSEVGTRKGSWKGGIMGTGINFLPKEETLDAFLRFCDKENLRFVDFAEAPHEKVFEAPTPKNNDFGILDCTNLNIA